MYVLFINDILQMQNICSKSEENVFDKRIISKCVMHIAHLSKHVPNNVKTKPTSVSLIFIMQSFRLIWDLLRNVGLQLGLIFTVYCILSFFST